MTSPFRRGVAVGLLAVATVAGFASTTPAAAEGELAVVELRPGDVVTRTFESINVMDGGTMIAPADCHDDAPSCDVIRVKLARDLSEDAQNFLRVELRWAGGPQAPDLALVVAGLGLGPTNDLDMYVYDEAETRIEGTGGATAGRIEVAAVLAEKDVYDFVINQFTGTTLEYEMEFTFSNELFDSPFEALDPAIRDGSGGFGGPVVDRSGESSTPAAPTPVDATPPSTTFDSFGSLAAPVEASAPAPSSTPRAVAADTDFAGFRGSVDDQLAGQPALQAAPAAAVRQADAPKPWILLFWLVLAPVGFGAALMLYVRRRRPAALSF